LDGVRIVDLPMPWRGLRQRSCSPTWGPRSSRSRTRTVGTSPRRATPYVFSRSIATSGRIAIDLQGPAGVDLVRASSPRPTCRPLAAAGMVERMGLAETTCGPPPGADLRVAAGFGFSGPTDPSCRRRHRPGGVRFGRPQGGVLGNVSFIDETTGSPWRTRSSRLIRRDRTGAVDEVGVNLLTRPCTSSRHRSPSSA